MESTPGGLGVAQKRFGARKRLATLQPCDGGLAGAHPASQLGLREPGPQASPQQLGGNLELWSERIILGLDLRIGEQTSLELFEWDRHLISFARDSASSISARG